MSKISELRNKKKELAIECRRILDNTPSEKPLSKADQDKYDALTLEINALTDRIDKEQSYLDLMNDDDLNIGSQIKNNKNEDFSTKMYKNWLKGGLEGLTTEESVAFRNTMSTTTGSEGGFTVPTNVASKLIEALKDYSSMRLVASTLPTESGAPLSYPTTDGTAEVGEFLAENTQASDLDVVFGTASLNVHMCSSKKVAVPFQLLQDSMIDIEKLVNSRLAMRIGRIANQKYTVGTGSAEPFGIVTRATVGKTLATGKTTAFDYDDLVDLQESVDDAYTSGTRGKWMFNQTVRRNLRKLKDLNNRPIWTPGYEMGITAGIPDLLMGSEVRINNDMASPAANAKSIVFGDLSMYMIRDAMQVSLFRFMDSVFVSKGQVGFMAFARTGGNLMDVQAVKSMQHSAT